MAPANMASDAKMPAICLRRLLKRAIRLSSCCSPTYQCGPNSLGSKVKMSDCICADATGSIVAGPVTGPQRRKNDFWGFDHDRAADAKRRMENHVSAVPVHAGEFCRQDRG